MMRDLALSLALVVAACGRVAFDETRSPAADVVFAQTFGGAGSEVPYAVAVDPAGNIIVIGSVSESDVDFGCAQHATSRQSGVDGFVVKLDPIGACLWVVPFIGAKYDQIQGVVVSPEGSVFVVGTTNSNAPRLGATVLATTPDTYQGFLARLDGATGSVDYVRRWGGAAEAYGDAIALTDSGDIVIGGSWSKASATEAIALPGRTGALAIGSPDVTQEYGIIAVYDQAGEPRWGRVVKTDGPVQVFEVAADANDDILVAGIFTSARGIDEYGYPGSGPLVVPKVAPDGGHAVFYMRITGTGTPGAPVWTKAWGSGVTDIEPTDIAVDPAGNNAIAFYAFEPQDLGAGEQTYGGGQGADMAIGGYRPDGSYLFGGMYGGAGYDFVDELVFSPAGERYFVGAMTSPVDFGGGDVTGFGGRDIVVAAFSRTGAHRWVASYGSSSDDSGTGIALGPQGLVVVAAVGGTLNVGDHHLVGAGASDILLAVLRP